MKKKSRFQKVQSNGAEVYRDTEQVIPISLCKFCEKHAFGERHDCPISKIFNEREVLFRIAAPIVECPKFVEKREEE